MIKKAGNFFVLLFVVPLLSGLLSCSQERQPCLTLKSALLNVNFAHYRDTGTAVLDTALPRPVFGAATDSGLILLFYSNATANVTLSLAASRDSCRWYFAADSLNPPVDTVDCFYTRQRKFLSNACGYTYLFSLASVRTTHNFIDSIIITDPAVINDVSKRNLKVFVRRSS